MSQPSLELIEKEITDFIRRIVISEKRNDQLERSAYIILRILSSNGPSGVKSLAEALQLDISTISRQAAALESKSYVQRIPNPQDKRAYFYQITTLGEEELDKNKQRRFERLGKILEDWSEEEQLAFGKLLQKYNQHVVERLKP
ncbi:MarR family winged helix-turn-helix transcriptional regulator [Gracilibacillus dipsosauri]|uniref:MarR family transcriptional regulator n=1 Tax=Gracilibacillus dipsosauri TaxID=178340 RepID=A0A317L1P7_9BACI|nr:MarR family transcriptional regulator [Gracilibacillus dipsosauri]PWU69781.1 MarR family transcriptional regulator [Gracilibacillus dipsosauri]